MCIVLIPRWRGTPSRIWSPKSASNTPYWGPGRFDLAGMDRMIAAQKIVGALSGEVDWSKLVDPQFLPDDQKTSSRS